VFIGSTNADTYLSDETGNRRFWPVRVGTIDLEGLRAAVPQLWAEAVTAYRAGERWWLDKEVEAAAAEEQAARRIGDPWEQPVIDWATRRTEPPTTAEVLTEALGLEAGHCTRADAMRVGTIFKAHRWERFRTSGPHRPWAYRRPTPPQGGTVGGTDKATDSAACPTVLPVPLNGPTYENGHATADGCAHESLEEFGENRGPSRATGTTRAAPGFSGQSPGRPSRDNPGQAGGTEALPWTDLDEWRARYRHAQGRDGRISVVLAWGRAAGGAVQDGETLALTLPPDLPNCLALAELRRVARDLKVLAP
jgi:hypothetical protein